MTSTTKSPKAAKRYTKSEGFRKDHKINWWLTAVVAVFSLTILIPLYFTIVTALKTPAEAGTFSLPTTWEWHNFADAWNYINYPKAALNSAIITVVAVCLTLLTNTFVAYAVARNMDKRFFRFLYYFFLAMMFVPFTVIMLPIAHQMGSLHLDNQLGLMLLYTILGLGTNLFIASASSARSRCRWRRPPAWTAPAPGASSGPSSSADGPDQLHDRHPDRAVGVERLPAAVDHADRSGQTRRSRWRSTCSRASSRRTIRWLSPPT